MLLGCFLLCLEANGVVATNVDSNANHEGNDHSLQQLVDRSLQMQKDDDFVPQDDDDEDDGYAGDDGDDGADDNVDDDYADDDDDDDDYEDADDDDDDDYEDDDDDDEGNNLATDDHDDVDDYAGDDYEDDNDYDDDNDDDDDDDDEDEDEDEDEDDEDEDDYWNDDDDKEDDFWDDDEEDSKVAPDLTPDDVPEDYGQNMGSDQQTEIPTALDDKFIALQTGPDVGPTYAGGMVYDPTSNSIFVTGATYGSFSNLGFQPFSKSACLFGVVGLPHLVWKQRETYGTEEAPEACNAVALKPAMGDFSTLYSGALVVGSTEEGGFMTDLGAHRPAEQYGMVMDISLKNRKYQFIGGAVLRENKINFPVAIETDEDYQKAFVATISAPQSKVSPDLGKVKKRKYPNLTNGGIKEYASTFSMDVVAYDFLKSGDHPSYEQHTLQHKWSRAITDSDGEPFTVTNMITPENEEVLLIVGNSRRRTTGGDVDGFIGKFSPSDGYNQGGTYFGSSMGKDDWIMNVCEDSNNGDYFYIVGATKGSVDITVARSDSSAHAFVAKIDLKHLTQVWVRQLAVKPRAGTSGNAIALGCDVIPGDELMYIAGNVENGATIDFPGTTARGQDDIFVAQIYTSDGSLRWIEQIGSNGNDRLAHSGGIAVNANKNAVVYGDTTGDFFRSREKTEDAQSSDLFVIVLNGSDGSHQAPLVGPPRLSSAITSNGGKIFGTVVLVLAVVGMLAFFCRHRKRTRKEGESLRRMCVLFFYYSYPSSKIHTMICLSFIIILQSDQWRRFPSLRQQVQAMAYLRMIRPKLPAQRLMIGSHSLMD